MCLFPYLLNVPAKRPPELRQPDDAVIFGFLGGSRDDKGFERLLPIIRAVCANPLFDKRRVRFIVQLDGATEFAKKLIGELTAGVSNLDVDVRFHEGTASAEQYAALLRQIHCLLLPYHTRQYGLSGSGILYEALLDGKPFICSSGLSFSEYARAGNAIEAEDDSAFAEAILRIVNNLAPFVEAAESYAQEYHASLQHNVLVQRLQHRANEGSPPRVFACSSGQIPMISPGG